MSLYSRSKIVALTLIFLLVEGCSTSILGPQIAKGTPPSPTEGSQVQGQSQPSATTCAADSTANIFLANTTVTLTYTCTTSITALTSNTAPSFLTGSFSGTAVTYTGTAAGDGTVTDWSFNVNEQSLTTGVTTLTTTVITPGSLTAVVTGTFAPESNNNSVISVSLDATLENIWADKVSDFDLVALSLSTDMHGLTVESNCSAPTPPYVCHSDLTSSSLNLSRALQVKWSFSAFDQGSYSFAINPRFSIESSNLDSSKTANRTFTIPIQTAGNIEVTHTETALNKAPYAGRDFPVAIAIGSKSTVSAPIVGLTFPISDGVDQFYGKRLLIDRSDDPTIASPDGVTQSGEFALSNDTNSQYMSIRSLTNGTWAVAGIRNNGDPNLYFNSYADSSTLSGSNPVGIDLTTVGSGKGVKAVSISKPFTDSDSKERIAVAFVYNDTNDFLNIAKINPTGTTKSTLVDDSNYDTEASGSTNQFSLDSSLGSTNVDRISIDTTTESSTRFFYVAYRAATDIKVTKISATYSSGYNPTTATLTSGGLSNTGSGAKQSLHMALGTSSGSTVVGVVYQNISGHCFFRRFDQTLATVSQELDLNTNNCYYPQIHFNSKSGRFLVTMMEQNVNNSDNKFEVVSTEITLATSASGLDTKSTSVVVREVTVGDIATLPLVHFATDFYEGGNWMAMFYRMHNTEDIFIHGYHVSPD